MIDSFYLQRRTNIWILSESQIRTLILHIGEIILKERNKEAFGVIVHDYRNILVISWSLERQPQAWHINDLKIKMETFSSQCFHGRMSSYDARFSTLQGL